MNKYYPTKELCFNGTLSKNVDLKQQYIKK